MRSGLGSTRSAKSRRHGELYEQCEVLFSSYFRIYFEHTNPCRQGISNICWLFSPFSAPKSMGSAEEIRKGRRKMGHVGNFTQRAHVRRRGSPRVISRTVGWKPSLLPDFSRGENGNWVLEHLDPASRERSPQATQPCELNKESLASVFVSPLLTRA